MKPILAATILGQGVRFKKLDCVKCLIPITVFLPALVLLLAGCVASPQPGSVTLFITIAVAKRYTNMSSNVETEILCQAVIDNRTGAPLIVFSNFYSAFDGLDLVVRDDHGRLLAQEPFIYHQSPYGSSNGRPFTLQSGRNTHDMHFSLTSMTNASDKLSLQLVGTLPRSSYTASLTSQVVQVSVKGGQGE